MQIFEKKVWIFEFPYEQTTLSIPVKAESKEEAVNILQSLFSKIQTELAMSFPKVQSVPMSPIIEPVEQPNETMNVPSPIPAEVLELRIDTLIADMGASQLKGKAKADTIKQWTGYDFNEANYTHIITELELIKTGQKEVPVKKK